jgi:two-component system sensor histidine kinase PhoQ
LVLVAFLGLAALALERAYRSSTLAGIEEKLQSEIYALLAAVEEGERGRMGLPEALPDPRLSRPQSGLYAWVVDREGRLFWRSASLVGDPPLPLESLPAGVKRFRTSGDWLLFLYGIGWEDDSGRAWPYTFAVAESRTGFERSVAHFRTTLWRWLGGVGVGLLLAQLLVLRWGLAPLRRLEKQLEAVRTGKLDRLEETQPLELKPLAAALNRLLEHSRTSLARHRHALDDLAHSLKTPLAYLQSLAEDESIDCAELRRAACEQLARMDATVRQQLHRAAASGRSALAGPVVVETVAQRVLAALERVYRERGMVVERRLETGAAFQGDEGDLMELLGNLLDNAFKYGRQRVRLGAACRNGLVLTIEDDGPGIPGPQWKQVLARGGRLDESQPGQGLGLAATAEMVALYKGTLELGRSGLGGLRVVVRLPGCESS